MTTYTVIKTSETNNKNITITEGITNRKEAENIADLFGGEVIAVFDVTEIMAKLLEN